MQRVERERRKKNGTISIFPALVLVEWRKDSEECERIFKRKNVCVCLNILHHHFPFIFLKNIFSLSLFSHIFSLPFSAHKFILSHILLCDRHLKLEAESFSFIFQHYVKE
jgi:hypothetical protein